MTKAKDKYECAIGFVSSKGLISKLIRKMTKPDDWTPSHVYLYLDRHMVNETHMGSGVRSKPAALYDGMNIRAYTPTFLNKTTRDNMTIIANFVTGASYGLISIPLFALDNLFGTFWFTRRLSVSHFKVCSQYTAWLYKVTPTVRCNEAQLYAIAQGEFDHPKALRYEFGCQWKSVTPNAMQNWCEKHDEEWSLI